MPRIKFEYKRFPALPNPAFPNLTSITKPVIPITLINGTNKAEVYALVDSGAYANLVSPVLAKKLGVSVENGKEHFAIGIGGQSQRTFFHNIKMEIGGHRFPCYAGFTEGLTVETCLLGQKGFFDQFKKIVFDYNAGEMELVW